MNSDPEKLRALLADVLPSSSEHCGPSSTEILLMLRHERQNRRRGQACGVLLALSAAALVSLLWSHKTPGVASVAQAPIEPAPIVIHSVNDEELLALLQGTPTALMKLPNGDRALLVIEPSSPP